MPRSPPFYTFMRTFFTSLREHHPHARQEWPDEPCPHCGGDGHLHTRVSTWDRYQEQHYPDWRNAGSCPRCDGTGWVLK